jgi:hypothetical protein
MAAQLQRSRRALERSDRTNPHRANDTLSTSPWITRAVAACLALRLAFAADDPAASEAKQEETEKLAKAAQNPVAEMISIPFQDDIEFGYEKAPRIGRAERDRWDGRLN